MRMYFGDFLKMLHKCGSAALVFAKIPRHLEKIPLRPKILGLRGIFTRCLGVEKNGFPVIKRARLLF